MSHARVARLTLAAALLGAAAVPPVLAQGAGHGIVVAGDGTRLFYERLGDGPEVVIVPAHLFTRDDFARRPELIEGRTLVFYDMRNRGRSDAVLDLADVSLDHDVADLDAVRAHLGAERVALIGYSYLGKMVALYATRHPERVTRIVQLGPVPPGADEYPEHLAAGDPMEVLDGDAVAELERVAAEGMRESQPREYCVLRHEVTWPIVFGDPSRVPRPPAQSICSLPNEWPANLARHFEASIPTVQAVELTAADLAAVRSPVLVIHGTRDRNAPYGAGRDWAMRFPDARLITLEGLAHRAFHEAPDRVFPAIDTFLGGAWPAAAERVTTLDPGPPAPGRPRSRPAPGGGSPRPTLPALRTR